MNARERYDSLFQFYAEQKGVNWKLLKAQAMAESGLNPDAKSKVGAVGLAQFMKDVWEEWKYGTMGLEPPTDSSALFDPRDPEDAIRAQAGMVQWLLVQFKQDVKLALASYNWGIGNVKRAMQKMSVNSFEDLETHMPEETQKYVKRILAFQASL